MQNREKRKINKVDYSTKEETAEAGLKTSHGNTNGILMEDEKGSGMSHAKEPHRRYSTNLLAALQGEVGQSTPRGWGWGAKKRRGKRQIGETEDMERKKLDKQVWQRRHQADARLKRGERRRG